MPTSSSDPRDYSDARGIAAGLDGALWFVEVEGNRIGCITTQGQITELPSSDPGLMAAGPDGTIWFMGRSSEKIGRITTQGQIREFPQPGEVK